jgi:hypothetical protein
MTAPKQHYSMWQHRDNPIVMIGDIIELTSPAEWHLGDHKYIVVPTGSIGEVFPWKCEYGNGHAIHFRNIEHPIFFMFPQATFTPGASRYTSEFKLLSRSSHAKNLHHPSLPHPGMPEPAPGPATVLPGVLGHGPAGRTKPGHAGSGQAVRQPGAQAGRGEGQGLRAGETRA